MSVITNAVNRVQSPNYSFNNDVGTFLSSNSIPKEERMESALRIAVSPFLWVNRVFNVTSYLMNLRPFAGLLFFFEQFYNLFSLPMKTVAGFVYLFLFIKTFYHIYLQNAFMSHMRDDYIHPLFDLSSKSVQEQVETLYESLKESANLRKDRELIQRSWTLIEECRLGSVDQAECISRINTIRHNLTLDAWLYVRDYPSTLANRVTVYSFEKIQSQMGRLIDDLQSSDTSKHAAAEAAALDLLLEMDEEARKVLTIHLIASITIILTIIGFILFAVGCPVAVPMFIYGLSYSFMAIEYVLRNGTQNHAGWDLEMADCIPNWIRGFFQTRPAVV